MLRKRRSLYERLFQRRRPTYPSAAVYEYRYERPLAKRFMPKGVLVLGEHCDTGEPICLTPDQLRTHLYLVGRTGSGKTTLLLHLIRQHLVAGRAVGVIAPEAELFRDFVLPLVPEKRAEDVIYFAPGNPENPVTFNPLEVESELDHERAGDDLFTIFTQALGESALGPRMEPILRQAFGALTRRPDSTLWDVKRLLEDASFRGQVAGELSDSYQREFWLTTYPAFPRNAHLPIVNRLDHFLAPLPVRRALCQPRSSFSLRDAMSEGRILLFDLSGLARDVMQVIGQTLLSRFQLELMRRERQRQEERRPLFFHADEFQTFASSAEITWRELFSRGRRFGLRLTLANQYPGQLPTSLQDEIFGNVGPIVSFALGPKDARLMRTLMLRSKDVEESTEDAQLMRAAQQDTEALGEPIRPEALLGLGTGRAFARIPGERLAIPLRTQPFEYDLSAEHGVRVRETSWKRYGGSPDHAAPFLRRETPEVVPDLREEVGERVTRAQVRELAAQVPHENVPVAHAEQPSGRGGPEHKYLQSLIKHYAEDRGYLATIEAQVPDGGRIDVLLERGDQVIACEISIASTPEQELQNIRKCLSAGCSHIAVVSPNRRTLSKVARQVEKVLPEKERAVVHCLTLEEFLAFLDEFRAPAGDQETTVRGYRVKTKLTTLDRDERDARKDSIVRTILRTLGRMKGQ